MIRITTKKTLTPKQMQSIYNEAFTAGENAANECTPTPMVVQSHKNMADDSSPVTKQWIVSDGPCGFAWVTIRPGNSRFANWLKKNQLARIDSYAGGVCIWISKYNQSMTKKEFHATAMAKVFREYGIQARSGSRMD